MIEKPNNLIYSNEKIVTCPNSKTDTWNQHPRVYLNIEKDIIVKCPYCGTSYTFENK